MLWSPFFVGDCLKDKLILESEDDMETTIIPEEGLCEFLLDDTYRDYLDGVATHRPDARASECEKDA